MALSTISGTTGITDATITSAKLADFSAAVDLNGVELILDADADTSITADTDDRIDFKLGGVEHISINNSSGDTVIKPMVDGKDIVFQQYDGNKILEINDGNYVAISGAAAGPGELRFYEDTDLGSHYTGFKAGNATASLSYVLPLADGSANQQLTTDGSGTLSWAAGGAVTALNNATDNELVTVGSTTTELDAEANLTFDGSTLTNAGATQLNSTLTVGANDQGYDVILYGDTASANLTWDTSADDLILNGAAGLIVPDGQLTLGSTAISSTAAEINLIDGGTARGTDALASGDGILINDAGTMKMTNVDTVQTFMQSGIVGKNTIWVPAAAITPTKSNGCASRTQVETTAGRPDMDVLDFDASSDEHAQFSVAFPKSWNLGTVTFQVFWTSTATDTDGVAWGLQGVACSNDGTIDVAYGTAVVVTDDNISAAEDLLVTSESSAITIAGTPADDDICYFRVFRDVSDGNDDMAEDARLIGLKLFYTTDAANDA